MRAAAADLAPRSEGSKAASNSTEVRVAIPYHANLTPVLLLLLAAALPSKLGGQRAVAASLVPSSEDSAIARAAQK